MPTTRRRGPPNQGEIAKRNAQKSAAALARLGPPRRVAYGSADIEKLDIYITKRPNAPVNVYIHGGAWRSGDAKRDAYMSETFVDAGAHFVSLDFNSVTDVGGNLVYIDISECLVSGHSDLRYLECAIFQDKRLEA